MRPLNAAWLEAGGGRPLATPGIPVVDRQSGPIAGIPAFLAADAPQSATNGRLSAISKKESESTSEGVAFG
jgi:hypothetical protein